MWGTFSYWVVPQDPLIALKKGYDTNLSIDFYQKYKTLMGKKLVAIFSKNAYVVQFETT